MSKGIKQERKEGEEKNEGNEERKVGEEKRRKEGGGGGKKTYHPNSEFGKNTLCLRSLNSSREKT